MHRVSEVGLKAKIDFTDNKIIVILRQPLIVRKIVR